MTTYELLRKLKDQLLGKYNNESLKETLITPIELMSLRKALKDIKLKKKNLPDISFILEYADFDSIYYFFFYYDREYGAVDFLVNIIDPWLIELIENDYNILVERIQPSDKIETFYANVISDMAELEKSYFEANYSHVTTLSSKILSSVFKQVCQKQGIIYSQSADHMQLYSLVKEKLNLSSGNYKDKDLQSLVKFTSSIENIVKHLNQLRNIYSDSHGVEEQKLFEMKTLKQHHFKLIVDSTKTIANFVIGTYSFQNERELSF